MHRIDGLHFMLLTDVFLLWHHLGYPYSPSPIGIHLSFTPSLSFSLSLYRLSHPFSSTPSSALNASRKCPNCQMPKSKMWMPSRAVWRKSKPRPLTGAGGGGGECVAARFRHLPLPTCQCSPLAMCHHWAQTGWCWPPATWQSELHSPPFALSTHLPASSLLPSWQPYSTHKHD